MKFLIMKSSRFSATSYYNINISLQNDSSLINISLKDWAFLSTSTKINSRKLIFLDMSRDPCMGDRPGPRLLRSHKTRHTSLCRERLESETPNFGAVLHEVRIGADCSCDKLFHRVCCRLKNITTRVEIVS
jgi:hypothetical protein